MRDEGRGRHLTRLIEMTKISQRVSPADRASAIGIKRTGVGGKPRISYVQFSARSERTSRPAVTGRNYAVKHVNAACDRFDQIFRGSNTHQVSRCVGRHPGRQKL